MNWITYAMIGQSVINVKSGGRTRLSTLTAGVVLLTLLLLLGPWVKQIPMAALVAVMIMVSIGTFSGSSFKNFAVHSKAASIVMLSTVVTVVLSHPRLGRRSRGAAQCAVVCPQGLPGH